MNWTVQGWLLIYVRYYIVASEYILRNTLTKLPHSLVVLFGPKGAALKWELDKDEDIAVDPKKKKRWR